MIGVYHLQRIEDRDLRVEFDFARGEKLVELVKQNRDKYKQVAVVYDYALDTAYRLTNSVESAWYENTDPEILIDKYAKQGCRSTSIGDLMRVGDNYYVVDSYGFTKIGPMSN